ncbi:PH domain-containing protein [Streptomyces sp. NPDC002467]|uniref:PH domain-containing protein n=1 Tax=Streptomyces sp. NPDC002467 TaxID=3364647 RepID=UPI0036810233
MITAIVVLFGGGCLKTADLPVSDGIKWLIIGLFVALGTFAVLSRPRKYTIVDDQGIVMRNFGRPRRIPWDGIHEFRTVALQTSAVGAAVPKVMTYAYRADGRGVPLPCVDSTELPDLAREVAALRSLLHERRRPDWAPDPRAERRIARRTAWYDGLYRWSSGWRVFAVGAGIAVVVLAGVFGAVFLFGDR